MKNIKLNNTTYDGISKVQLPTADGGTASFKDEDEIVAPVLKTGVVITPTTGPQNIPVPDGFDGFDAFAVEAVTAAIDPNIVEEKIKKGVTILNVTGTYEAGSDPVLKTGIVVTPTTEPQDVPVPDGFDGFGAFAVEAVTAAIDANITEEKIKKNVTILGVTGSYEGETPAPKTPTIQVAQDGLITVSGDGIVTTTHKLSEDDDPAFTSANIAKNTTIFGKPGAHEGGGSGWTGAEWTTIDLGTTADTPWTDAFANKIPVPANYTGWLLIQTAGAEAVTSGTNQPVSIYVYIRDGATVGGLFFYFVNKLAGAAINMNSHTFLGYPGCGSATVNTQQIKVGANGYMDFPVWGSNRYVSAGTTVRYAFVPINMDALAPSV